MWYQEPRNDKLYRIHVWIERFTKLKPLAFRSAATPAEAEDWITLRLPPVTSSYCMRAGIRISGIEMVIGFRTGDRVNRRSRVDQRSAGRNGNDSQGQGQRRSTETLPPPPLYATCGKPHLGVCYKATGGCFTCGSTQHKVKDCPQGKQKQSMSTDLARLPPTTRRVYATTRGQATKTSDDDAVTMLEMMSP
nr:hypothetical protein [Tanacetum cinerariifolium]